MIARALGRSLSAPAKAVAGAIWLAAITFSVCAICGIDPGPAGALLADLIRDLLRL